MKKRMIANPNISDAIIEDFEKASAPELKSFIQIRTNCKVKDLPNKGNADDPSSAIQRAYNL